MASTVDLIKERLSITDVVGSYVELQKAGSSFKAKCPFHNEKTPSFFVSPARGSYYCFGCGAKGDIFTFVQEFEGVDFMGALKVLADRAGVSIVMESQKDRTLKERLFKLMDESEKFFSANLLKNKEAVSYLRGRGLTDKTIKEWHLGFAKGEWHEAYDFLKTKNFSVDEIKKAGIVKEESGRVYDRFRSRIMFPMFDSAGRTIAFSGRIFGEADDGKAPKYLNSPETPLFSKSRVLFGFDRAKSEIRRLDYAILVEGQMDLLVCHQEGYKNAVATSGTSLTEEHLTLLNRLSKRVMFVFDADRAGVSATLRSAAMALSIGMEVKVADLPKGSDPAELIIKDKENWRNCLKSAKHIIDFYLDVVIGSEKEERALLRALREKVLPYVKALESGIDRSHYIKKVAEAAGVSEAAVSEDLKKAKMAFEAKTEQGISKEPLRQSPIETIAVGVLIWQKSLPKPDIDTKSLEKDLQKILGKKRYEEYIGGSRGDAGDFAFRAEFYYGGKGSLNAGLSELLLNLEEEILKEELTVEMKKVNEAEHGNDEKKKVRALERCRDLSRKLDEVKNKRYCNNRL